MQKLPLTPTLSPRAIGLSGETRNFLQDDIYLPSPPAGGGRGQGEGADEPVRGTAHLTLPLRGPLPLPPEGRRGALANRIRELAG